jgi:hypothetical protein
VNKPTFKAAGLATGSLIALVTVMAASVSAPARAEYRCSPPSLPQDRNACELAKRDTPDELRRYTDPTRNLFGLYFYDYVSAADLDRWAAGQDKMARSDATPAGRNGARKTAVAAR